MIKQKFRKKPVVIEAYQTDKELEIETLEGTMHARIGDWIITGVNGDPYPCKPDIFRKTYEPAVEAKKKELKWIPVTKELPTLNDDGVSDMVLLCWSDGQRTVGAYRGDRTFVGQAWPEAKDVRVTVTAWMPLPEPYVESEE